jgi:hypothetical protein
LRETAKFSNALTQEDGGIYWALEVAVVEASTVGTIEGAWMMTVRVDVEVRLALHPP